VIREFLDAESVKSSCKMHYFFKKRNPHFECHLVAAEGRAMGKTATRSGN
jgi:hypothetical protein